MRYLRVSHSSEFIADPRSGFTSCFEVRTAFVTNPFSRELSIRWRLRLLASRWQGAHSQDLVRSTTFSLPIAASATATLASLPRPIPPPLSPPIFSPSTPPPMTHLLNPPSPFSFNLPPLAALLIPFLGPQLSALPTTLARR